MADIRVERKTGSRMWLWVLLALVVLVIAVLLLDYFGYIQLPVQMGAADAGTAPAAELQPVVVAHTLEA